jgi:hypothetical protein
VLLVATNWPTVLQRILFALFSVLTGILTAIIGPTYDNLFVPMMAPSALFPGVGAGPVGGPDFLGGAASFAAYTIGTIVDPAITLLAVGVAVLLLVRAVVSHWADPLSGLLPRLVVAVIVANFTVPIAGGILDVAGALYPVLADWNGAAWDQWQNLAGWGQIAFSWDNGALAFVLSFVEFFAVFGLLLLVGVRDALLAALLVLLPLFTLLWPIRPLASVARRGWLLFIELAFLPCVVVVPLQLAVDAPSPVMLVGYLGVALAAPFLLSVAGTHLTAFGAPGGSGVFAVGTQRGLGAGSSAATSIVGPSATATARGSAAGPAVAGTLRAGGTAALPAAAPLAVAEALGHAAQHLLHHVNRPPGGDAASPSGPWPAMRDRRGR